MIAKIKIPIYFGTLLIYQGKLSKIPKKWFNLSPGFKTHGNAGICYFFDNKHGYRYYWIAFENPTDSGQIAHEALHCVNNIFKDRAIYVDFQNHEHEAYLIQWIVKQCHKYLKVN